MFNLEHANKVFEHWNVPAEWQHEVNGLIVPFNPEWKSIAVNVSGGADSACGTSTLAKIIQDNGYDCKIHFITHVRVWHNRPWAGPISIDVYNKIKDMFPNVIGDRLQNYIPPEIEEASVGPDLINGRSGDRIAVDSFNMYCQVTYNLDAVYNTVTLNPMNPNFVHSSAPHDRFKEPDYTQKRNPMMWTTNGKYHIQPFKFVEKDWVMAQYVLNEWEDLLNTTRSCEGDIMMDPKMFVDYTEYVHGETELHECGRCFWCAERTWAKESAERKINEARKG